MTTKYVVRKNDVWDSSKKLMIFSFIEQNSKEKRSLFEACRAAIKKYELDITVDVLRKRFGIFIKNHKKERSNMLFDITTEQSLVAYLEAWARMNRPLSKSQFMEHLNCIRQKNGP